MQGNPAGIYSTAAAFLFGKGTSPDRIAAFVWLSLLSPREDSIYADMYAYLENSLTKGQRDLADEVLSYCIVTRLGGCP
jgi:hypothetical protein